MYHAAQWPYIIQKTFRNTKIETTKVTKRNLISDDFEQLSVKLVISVDSKSTDLSRAGNWCFETETEEPTNHYNFFEHYKYDCDVTYLLILILHVVSFYSKPDV